jgi:fatty acid desaturase
MVVGSLVIFVLPDWAMFKSPFRQVYSCRFAAVARLCFFMFVLSVLAYTRWMTTAHSSVYPVILWLLPLITSLPFFMYLRDVYQHSNADTGRLTNSRVFFTDPLTRWAIFVYGQDMHIPHHLFPAIPHYQLPELHRILKRVHSDYGELVVECHGTFSDPMGRATILDEMTSSRPHADGTEPVNCSAGDLRICVMPDRGLGIVEEKERPRRSEVATSKRDIVESGFVASA